MPLVILIEENLAAAKAALHSALPSVRSAQLAEAIAAGLGYNSQRALKTALTECDGLHPPLAEAAEERFTRRLGELGYTAPASGLFSSAFSAKSLPVAPYIVTKYHDRAARDRHFFERQRSGWPMMVVRVARKYAKLEWDCITVDPSEEAHVMGKFGVDPIDAMSSRYIEIMRDAPGRPKFFGSAFTGTAEQLSFETAEMIAEEYFQLLYGPLNEQRRLFGRAAPRGLGRASQHRPELA